MDYKTVQKLCRLQGQIDALTSKIPANVSVVANKTILTDAMWRVAYSGETLRLELRGDSNSSEVLPDGVEYQNLTGKHYLLFTNGADKPVNYLVTRDQPLTLKRLAGARYNAVNPMQDYIVDISPTRLKEERAEVEKMREYVRNLWDMVELPNGFVPSTDKAKVRSYRDTTAWHDLVVMSKFYYLDRARSYMANDGWIKRVEAFRMSERKTPTHKGLMRRINEFFETYHLSYEVKKKSPFTPPHWNAQWNQLERLREAGLVPE